MPLGKQDVMNARDQRGITLLDAITPAGADLAYVPAWIMVSTDCTVTMTFWNAVSVALPLKAGVQYAIHPCKITAVSAGTCWTAPAEGPTS